MSLDIFIVLKRSALPSASEWANAIRREGFNVDLDWSFDTGESSGFRPCPSSDRGFEYSLESLSISDIEVLDISPELVRTFDSVVGLHYKTEADSEIVTPASAVLAKLTGGVVVEAESGAVMNSDQALAWARGEFEPISRPPTHNKKSLSPATLVKLVIAVLFVCYVFFQWAKG